MSDTTPEGFEAASVAAIMRRTGVNRDSALQNFRAIDEGQRVYNAAKKLDRKNVTVSRATLFRLTMAAAVTLGMDVATRDGPDAGWNIVGSDKP